MKIYRIKGWTDNFESSRSKEIDSCTHIYMPNKQHGMGFTHILSQPDGPGVFGIWTLIAQGCSLQTKPRNGWMTDNGTKTGKPWTVQSMSLRWRAKAAIIERALEILTSEDVGWIEVIETDGSSSAVHGVQNGSASAVQSQLSPERSHLTRDNITQHNNNAAGGDDDDSKQTVVQNAEKLYLEYPKHVAKPKALKAIENALKRADFATLLQGVLKYKAATAGKEAQYIAHPASWFNGDRWLDEDVKPSTPQAWTPKTDLSELPDDIFEPNGGAE